MFTKKNIKARVAHFSSEDSQVSDYSMNSSFEAEQPEDQTSTATKFNQLRETMNQLFLSNPELAEEIKFQKHYLSDEFEPELPKTPAFNSPMHSKKTSTVPEGGFSAVSDDFTTSKKSNPSKFWSAISSEMIKPQKNSKMPTLNQVNHILNIYKMKPDKPEGAEIKLSPKKPSTKKPNSRVQSAKVSTDKQTPGKGKDAKTPTGANNAEIIEEEEDGVKYYSFKKKMHLKLKQKWVERELENQARKRQLELEREKQLQEREHERMMSTLAGLDEEIIRNQTTNQDEIEMFKKKNKRPASQPKRNSNKTKGDIFERLTKDMNLKETPEEDDLQTKRVFLSQFAETLYKDMKEFGDPEAFKKIAQVRIQTFKKDFKERLGKLKVAPQEQLKFNKNKYRYLNMFVMDFEKTAQILNKDSVFVINEIQKDSEEWKENPELDILAKFQKVRQGNILGFWQEAKDLNNQ